MLESEKLHSPFARELPRLESKRLIVRMCQAHEAPAVVAYFEKNRWHLQDYSPTWPDHMFTTDYWRKQLLDNIVEFHADEAVKFFLFEKEQPDTVIGTINFTSILRRAAQFCFLGYGLDEDLQGRGYMTEGLERAVAYMFDDQNLHRIMANYMPTNERSGKVLKKLGFVVEGYARDYLLLNGKWRDHIMTALNNERWRANVR